MTSTVSAGTARIGPKMNIPSLAMISGDEGFVLRYGNRVFAWEIYGDRTKLSTHETTLKIAMRCGISSFTHRVISRVPIRDGWNFFDYCPAMGCMYALMSSKLDRFKRDQDALLLKTG